MLFLLALLQVCSAYFDADVQRSLYRREYTRKNFNQTFFSSLESYEVNASPATEAHYPWIARVVHSKSADVPHICTASCIANGIFITAARCIDGLKVRYTSVVYQNKRLLARAFVIPSNGTKQAFDDIGFIVLHKNNMTWKTVKLFSKNRTDDKFRWFERLPATDYKVVGYATQKGIHRVKSLDRMFNLTELHIVIGLDICSKILTFQHRMDGFNIPCYHSCTAKEFSEKAKSCKNYHGVEGGAVIHKNKEVLLGVAIWGPYFINYELPVGFSVVNSVNFFHDYECAKRIWKDDVDKVTKGYYQKLCDSP